MQKPRRLSEERVENMASEQLETLEDFVSFFQTTPWAESEDDILHGEIR